MLKKCHKVMRPSKLGSDQILIVDSILYLKVNRIFFKTITKVLDSISGITKNIIFFHLKACETFIFVCFYGCVVCPAGVWGPA